MTLIVIITVAAILAVGALVALLLRVPGSDADQLTVAAIQARLNEETETEATADR
ncbi:hypothetical protein [Nocardia sp. XZ_19_385]|uniref:hypothetical protein n=1 Tax=Nocardia sp. XZ_19_385 TaxID=2769488 RepID=UPI0018909D97|nr:hypothetical protein [Nocardia sp. XZ_19_385]